MSVRSHVIVNVDEIGGDVVGNHGSNSSEDEDSKVAWMSLDVE